MGRRFAFPTKGEWALMEVLCVPRDVEDIYAKNRIESLELLLDIVKGARPKDALLAAAYAIALEDDIGGGAFIARYPTDKFDEPGKGGISSRRDQLVEELRQRISKARPQQPGAR
jgi:hypothetical protein